MGTWNDCWPGTWKTTKSVQKTDAVTIMIAVSPQAYVENIFEEQVLKDASNEDVRPGFMYEQGINEETALPHLYKVPSRQCWLQRGLETEERGDAVWKYPWDNNRLGHFPPTAAEILEFWKFQEWGKYMLGPKNVPAVLQNAPFNRVFITNSLERNPAPLWVDIAMLNAAAADPNVTWENNYSCEAELTSPAFRGIPMYPLFCGKYTEAVVHQFIRPSPRNPNLGSPPGSIPSTIAYRFVDVKAAEKAANPKPAKKAALSAAHRRRASLGAKIRGAAAAAGALPDLAAMIMAPLGQAPPDPAKAKAPAVAKADPEAPGANDGKAPALAAVDVGKAKAPGKQGKAPGG
jgi:hypothetical protein